MNVHQLFAQIGGCLVMCQRIELHLATLLCLERGEKGVLDAAGMLIEFARLRESVLGRLKRELFEAKATYLDFEYLDSVIEKRNWLVHHLSFDPTYLQPWDPKRGDFSLDLTEDLDFFERAGDYCFQTLVRRGAELGYRHSDFTRDAGKVMLVQMADAVAEIRRLRKEKRKAANQALQPTPIPPGELGKSFSI